jgi:hypothetical protein
MIGQKETAINPAAMIAMRALNNRRARAYVSATLTTPKAIGSHL